MKYLAMTIDNLKYDNPKGWWFKCSKCKRGIFYPSPDFSALKYCPRCGCGLYIEPFDL